MFFNAIRSLPNFGEESSLEMIKLLGEGSMGDVFSTQFVSFIHHKMDKLITVERMMDTTIPFSKIEDEIKASVKSNESYRGDIAYVLSIRLINYTKVNFTGPASKDILFRMGELLKSDAFGSDLKFIIGKKITSLDTMAFIDLLEDQLIVDAIIT